VANPYDVDVRGGNYFGSSGKTTVAKRKTTKTGKPTGNPYNVSISTGDAGGLDYSQQAQDQRAGKKPQTQQQPKAKEPEQKPTVAERGKSLLSRAMSAGKGLVDTVKTDVQKGANTAAALGANTVGLTKAGVEAATGKKQQAKQTLDETRRTSDVFLDYGFGGKGGVVSSKQANSSGGGAKGYKDNFVKPVVKGAAEYSPYVAPVIKGGSLISKAVKSATAGAAQSAVTDAAAQAVDTGKVDAKQTAKNAVLGGLIGAAAPVADKALAGKPKSKQAARDLAQQTAVQTLLERARKQPDATPEIQAKPVLDPITQKSLDSVMSGIHTPKSTLEAQSAEQASIKAAEITKQAELKATEKATADTKKIDRQLEVLQAKAKDAEGKLSNVDQVKVKQLKEQKAEIAQTLPTTARADTTPTIKVFGKTIPLTKENGYRAVPTSLKDVHGNTVHIYQKGQRVTSNNRGNNVITSYWYNSKGTKLTEAQAQAAIKGDQRMAGVDNVIRPQKLPEDQVSASSSDIGVAPDRIEGTRVEIPDSTTVSRTKPLKSDRTNSATSSSVKNSAGESVIPSTIAENKPTVNASDTIKTARLTPSQTAHLETIGGYNHSTDMTKDFADMMREMDKQVKGGQMIPDGEGGYTRTSEHTPFYRAFYAEHKKPPTKADYLEESERQLSSGHAMYGASDDYKKLIDREGKPLPNATLDTPIVPGTGPTRTSGLAKGVEAKAVQAKLTKSLGDLPQYSKVNMKDQAEQAAKLLADDEQLANRIALGHEAPPSGLLPESIYIAVENKALADGNIELIRELAGSVRVGEATAMGQRIRALAERNPESAVSAISDLKSVREKAFTKKAGKSAKKATSDEVKAIRKATPKVTKETWSSFVAGLQC
jgi:hypothetical protein